MTISPLRQFVLAALLWLPATFFLWFALSSPIIWPVAKLADLLLPALMPNVFTAVDLVGAVVEIETKLITEAGPGGQRGLLVLDVRPLIYAWCLPLFVGLSMATPLSGRQRLKQIAIGFPILLLVVTWGVVFDAVKLLTFDAGPLGAAAIAASGWSNDLVALGYQFGYLILPTVVPVSLWVTMNRVFLESLVGWRGEPEAADAGQSQPTPSSAPASDDPQ